MVSTEIGELVYGRPLEFRPNGSPWDRPSTEMVLKRLLTPATEIEPDAGSSTVTRGSRRATSSSERLPCGVISNWRPSTEVPTPRLSALNTTEPPAEATAVTVSRVVISGNSAALTFETWFRLR